MGHDYKMPCCEILNLFRALQLLLRERLVSEKFSSMYKILNNNNYYYYNKVWCVLALWDIGQHIYI